MAAPRTTADHDLLDEPFDPYLRAAFWWALLLLDYFLGTALIVAMAG